MAIYFRVQFKAYTSISVYKFEGTQLCACIQLVWFWHWSLEREWLPDVDFWQSSSIHCNCSVTLYWRRTTACLLYIQHYSVGATYIQGWCRFRSPPNSGLFL